MRTTPYTTIHDLTDIFLLIYQDCPNWYVRFWNFTERKYMYLTFDGIEFNEEGNQCPVFIASYKKHKDTSKHLITGLQWQNILNTFESNTNGISFSEYSKVIVRYNNKSGKLMKIYFTGSDRTSLQIHYNIDWEDYTYHAWKRIWFMKWVLLKCKISKLYNNIKKIVQ